MSTSFPSASLDRPQPNRRVAIWIFICAAFVLAMVVVGGVTRLTRSGLSIVEWKPITGILPPLSAEAWQAEFAKYQTSPEFLKVNHDMTIDGFRSIFLVEWFHRLLGRLVGFVVAVPFAVFAWQRRLSWRRVLQMASMFVFGGLQGALGWFMVKSGLDTVPRVSPYRLTAHLMLALGIFCGLLWAGLDEWYNDRRAEPSHQVNRPVGWPRLLPKMLLLMVLVTLAWGGLMAGLHAGHVAPTFPTMNGLWIPEGMSSLQPSWRNPFENALTVHFLHRTLAYCTTLVALAAVSVTLSQPNNPASRRAAIGIVVTLLLQVALGAWTVLSHVPVSIAAWHQGNAVLLLGWTIALIHAAGMPIIAKANEAPQQAGELEAVHE